MWLLIVALVILVEARSKLKMPMFGPGLYTGPPVQFSWSPVSIRVIGVVIGDRISDESRDLAGFGFTMDGFPSDW